MSVSKLTPSASTGIQNFYGFKYNAVTDELTIEEFLWGDITEQIVLPQVNDDGTPYTKYAASYVTEAVTPYQLSFSWDTYNKDQLIMEVE
jgi:hypothetical protein